MNSSLLDNWLYTSVMLQLLGTAGTVKLYTALCKTLLILSYDPYSIL